METHQVKFTAGADPECFLVNTQGKFISSVGLIGGSKEYPMPLPLGPGYAVQEDNVSVEFNIPPAQNIQVFSSSIMRTVGFLSSMVQDLGLKLSDVSAVSFDQDQLQTPASQEFGCEPDFNAWADGEVNPRPSAKDKSLRTCGGHVHVGYDGEVSHLNIIKFMDMFLGVPSVLMDKGETRKQLYGCAGAFRKKEYGVEYRTLSNFWIFKKELHEWVWRNTQRAIDAAIQSTVDEEDGKCIVSAINGNNKPMAEQLVKKYNLEVL